MKKISLLLLVVVVLLVIVLGVSFKVKGVRAECGMFGMAFFPEQQHISLNPMFIFEGYGRSQETINSFAERKVYLKSEKTGNLIELKHQDILKGEMNLTQAVFKPEKALEPNTKYFLQYSNQTEIETEGMRVWNSKTNEEKKVFWQTSEVGNAPPPNPDIEIEFKKNSYVPYGCGPAEYFIFDVLNQGDAEIWYKTELVSLSTDEKTVFYLKALKDELKVGHGMCAGAFVFSDKGKYKVRFTPINMDGDSLDTTGWMVFENPYATNVPVFESE